MKVFGEAFFKKLRKTSPFSIKRQHHFPDPICKYFPDKYMCVIDNFNGIYKYSITISWNLYLIEFWFHDVWYHKK